MSPRAALCAALVLTVSMAACRKPDAAARPGDAGPAEAPARDAAPAVREPRWSVVAAGASASATATSDGRILVTAGPTVWQAERDGALTRLAGAEDFDPSATEDDGVVGYVPARVIVHARGAGPGGATLDTFDESGRAQRFAIENRRIVAVPRSDAPPPPPDPEGTVLTSMWQETGDGRSVAVGARDWTPRMLVSKGGVTRAIAFAGTVTSCALVPSFDRSVVASCLSGGRTTYHRLEGERLEAAFEGAVSHEVPRAQSIAADGSLYWISEQGERGGLVLHHCPTRGACTEQEVELPAPAWLATYEALPSEFVERGTGRSWQAIRIGDEPPGLVSEIVIGLFARAPDDIWMLTTTGGRARLVHTGAPAARRLPSVVDARVMARNTRPPSTWSGPCDQVFVRLGADADAVATRRDELVAAVGTSAAFEWWLVDGYLHERRVAGVVLVRRDADQKLRELDEAAERLVTAFATGPANRPSVFCTLPVLERKLLP